MRCQYSYWNVAMKAKLRESRQVGQVHRVDCLQNSCLSLTMNQFSFESGSPCSLITYLVTLPFAGNLNLLGSIVQFVHVWIIPFDLKPMFYIYPAFPSIDFLCNLFSNLPILQLCSQYLHSYMSPHVASGFQSFPLVALVVISRELPGLCSQPLYWV